MTRDHGLGCSSLVIGCGYSSQRNLCKCDHVLAIDIDKKKILQAHNKDRNASYVACDARFLPLKPNYFADIVCTEVLEHIIGYEKVLINIIKLKPRLIHLEYPTETREKILTRASRIYREQHWGKIHVTTVKTRRITDILEGNSYKVHIDFSPATSTFSRLVLQALLEKLGIGYTIPDVGWISFSENRKVYRFINSLCLLIGLTGYLPYFLWKYLKIATIHDHYTVTATLREKEMYAKE